MHTDAIERKYQDALQALVNQVRQDRTVVAAILCGSLAHDRVWEKSDIDLVLVTVDERTPRQDGLAINSQGVNIHALLVPRGDFRKAVEGSIRHSFTHSFLTKGRLLYTHDPTIEDLCRALADLGERDRRVQLLRAGIHALPPIDKAHKWLATRGDLDYTALWILYAATPLAQIEVIGRGLLADREVIPQALALNPPFFRTIYTDLLGTTKTRAGVEGALQAVDAYVAARTDSLFGAILEYLREAGEARSCTEIEAHFERNLGVGDAATACEYLSDRGLIGKASLPARLTRRSTVDVQELAFFAI